MMIFRHLFPALFIPVLLLGIGCSRESLSTDTDRSTEIQEVVLEDGTYLLDALSSSIVWNAKKRVGAHHTGTINAQQGAVMIEGGAVTGGRMEVDTRTIADTDLTNEKDNKKLVGHLKSKDFFNVAVYPTATFALEEARAVALSADASHEVTGTMAIKGIENEITFPAVFVMTDAGLEMTGVVTLDRTLWDVRYGSGKFFENLGDELIEDEFTLTLNLIFTLEE